MRVLPKSRRAKRLPCAVLISQCARMDARTHTSSLSLSISLFRSLARSLARSPFIFRTLSLSLSLSHTLSHTPPPTPPTSPLHAGTGEKGGARMRGRRRARASRHTRPLSPSRLHCLAAQRALAQKPRPLRAAAVRSPPFIYQFARTF